MRDFLNSLSIFVSVFNTILWIFNWIIMGYFFHVLWKEKNVLAPLLLTLVMLSNCGLVSIFFTSTSIIYRQVSQWDSDDTEDEYTIRRRTFRVRPPVWGEKSEPSKEV